MTRGSSGKRPRRPEYRYERTSHPGKGSSPGYRGGVACGAVRAQVWTARSVVGRQCYVSANRAFAQRSRWQRDRLLEVGELSRYDRELKEAWERFFLPVGDDDQDVDEDGVRRRARERFAELDRSNLAPIRRDVREGWVARGSLHVIADRLEIGWHPQWLAHLRDRLGEVRDDPAAGAAA